MELYGIQAALLSCESRSTEWNRRGVVGNHNQPGGTQERSRRFCRSYETAVRGRAREVQCNLDSFEPPLHLTSSII